MWSSILVVVIAGASLPALLHSQEPAEPAELRLLRTCVAHAAAGDVAASQSVGRNAESLYRKRLAANPRDVEALVGTARSLSQCQLPGADFISQGELSATAMELLDQALELQPDHWLARFVLASIALRSPAFLGRGKRAATEFDRLLRMQGDRTDDPMFARVFELRGTQLGRSGEPDSARALWSRGASLFPADARLRALVDSAAAAKPDAKRPTETGKTTLRGVDVVVSSSPAPAPLPSVREISRSQILMPAGGAADIIQAVQSQPGATRVGEGSDVYTRGGHPGETALLVNGGRLLSLSRFEGLSGGMFGALEPFVVKSVKYSSGGFSARHGNALSGVVEIETDGKPRERQLRAGLSLVQASGTARAPAGPKAGGWISGRASRTDALLATHGRSEEFEGAPHSEEIIGSFIVTPTPMSEIRMTAIAEQDDSRRVLSAAGWNGTYHSAGSLRALHLGTRWLSARAPVVIRTSIAGSSRSSDWDFGVLSRERDDASLVSRLDAEWQAAPQLSLRAGVEQGAFSRNDRGTLPTTSSVATGSPIRVLSGERERASQLGGYSEAELGFAGSTLIVGIRADRLPGESQATVDPRIALSSRRGAWTGRLSAGLFHQGSWRGASAIPEAGSPGGTPTAARHLVAGFEHDGAMATIRGEAFEKRYAEYRRFGDGPQIAAGRSRGIDLVAQRASAKWLTGWVGYSYLDASVTLDDGRTVRSPYDVTHTGIASATASLGRDWSVGSTARYGTGTPVTPISGGTTGSDGRVIPSYGAPMSARLTNYARVDARLMRFVRTSTVLLTTFVEVINLGNRSNVSALTYDASYQSSQPVHTFFAKRTIVAGGELQLR